MRVEISLKFQDLSDIGGNGLLKKYGNSVSLLLATALPEYNWEPWKYPVTPKNYWESMKNQRKFVEWAGKELKIKEMSDWYKIEFKVKKT